MFLDETFRVKVGLAEMLKGGVIMDVTNAEQALVAEKAGAASYGDPRADIERAGLSTGLGCGSASPGKRGVFGDFRRRGKIQAHLGLGPRQPGRLAGTGPEPPSSVCDAIARRAGADGKGRPLLRSDPGAPERSSAGSSGESPSIEGRALPRPSIAPGRDGKSVDPRPKSCVPPEAIVGPSGAREVSDFSTGTVETASNRLGGELPGAAGDWAGSPASGTTVEGSGRPSRLDRSSVLPCCVIWSAASGPARALEVCGGACEGSRAIMSGEGNDSPGWTSTRAILRGGGSGSLFGVAAFLATCSPIDLVRFDCGRGSGVFGGSLAASGMATGAGASVLGSGNSSPFCRTMARASGGLASSILAASGRRMSNGPLGSGSPAHAQRRDLDIGARGIFGRRHRTIQIPRLQLGGRRGLLANGRGHHFFEGLLGLLLLVLGPMIVGRRRFVVGFRLGIADRVRAGSIRPRDW